MNSLLSVPIEARLAYFRHSLNTFNAFDEKSDLRALAANLLSDGLISMSEYVSVLGGHALFHITQGGNHCFVDMKNGANIDQLVNTYSRAKFGGVDDIAWLAKQVTDYLEQELDNVHSEWQKLFLDAFKSGDNVVLMTTGWRNVPSTANVLFDIVVEEINIKLAHMGLPTIVNVKLPRIAPPCENYASLSQDERHHVNLVQDHVIPDRNFYQWGGVHVIFGDDILVTGATADKVLHHSLNCGAKSFRAIYPLAVDPSIALNDASVEERINGKFIDGTLSEELACLLSAKDYQPILRTLRLLFGEPNRPDLEGFLPLVPDKTWLKLYRSALGNEFLRQPETEPSLKLLRKYLEHKGILKTKTG